MLDKLTAERLRRAIHAWEEAELQHVDATQECACFEAVEFLLNARVVRCSIHIHHVDTMDGRGVTSYLKAQMSARLEDLDQTVRRTVIMTTNPFAQVLRAFANFEWNAASGLSAALRDLIPKEQWARLASQLAVEMEKLKKDPVRQAAFEGRLETARRKIFEKERDGLLHEMERLLRRGWTKERIQEVWDEAVVKDVMES